MKNYIKVGITSIIAVVIVIIAFGYGYSKADANYYYYYPDAEQVRLWNIWDIYERDAINKELKGNFQYYLDNY